MPETGLGNQKTDARAQVMEQARAIAGELPMPKLRSLVCPYCGTVTPDSGRCSVCAGRFDPLSRQATQNQMGPWSIRDDAHPHRPGCSYETIARLIEQRKISGDTILRGPTTRQFWTLAKHSPGIAHLLGVCHSCQTPVKSDAFACPNCHASFTAERDRQHLGLGPARPLPGQGLPEVLALRAEPASQAGHSNAGVVSATIGAQEGGNGALMGGAGSVGAQQEGLQGFDLASARQQVEDAARLARRWKSAWEAQRRRAWGVIGASLIVTVVALGYALWSGIGSPDRGGAAGLDQKTVSPDE